MKHKPWMPVKVHLSGRGPAEGKPADEETKGSSEAMKQEKIARVRVEVGHSHD